MGCYYRTVPVIIRLVLWLMPLLTQEQKKKSLIITIVSLAIALSISYVFASRMLKPLKTLGVVAEKVRAGDFTVRSQHSGKDEIALLGDTINGMIENLEAFLAKFHSLRTKSWLPRKS